MLDFTSTHALPDEALRSGQPGEPDALEVSTILVHAAGIAVANGVSVEDFVQAAWSAYLDARPELREELEDKELKAQLKKLRKRGLVGTA